MSILFFFFFFFNDTATTEIYTLSLHDALPISVTDEPGLYLAGRFGVRIENTLLIKPYKETAFGRFLQMESLTLRSEEHTSELQSRQYLVCRLLLEKKKKNNTDIHFLSQYILSH